MLAMEHHVKQGVTHGRRLAVSWLSAVRSARTGCHRGGLENHTNHLRAAHLELKPYSQSIAILFKWFLELRNCCLIMDPHPRYLSSKYFKKYNANHGNLSETYCVFISQLSGTSKIAKYGPTGPHNILIFSVSEFGNIPPTQRNWYLRSFLSDLSAIRFGKS